MEGLELYSWSSTWTPFSSMLKSFNTGITGKSIFPSGQLLGNETRAGAGSRDQLVIEIVMSSSLDCEMDGTLMICPTSHPVY